MEEKVGGKMRGTIWRMWYKLGRRLEQVRALVGGFYWLPCSLCGEYFSGRESGKGFIYEGVGAFRSVCPKAACIAEAERLTAEVWASEYKAEAEKRRIG